MSHRLEPQVRLRARSEFIVVQEQGRRASSAFMTVLARPNGRSCDRLGVIASRKLGGAVARNRVKRRLRALFRLNDPDLSPMRGHVALDVVIIPRRELAVAPFETLRVDLRKALARIDRTRSV